MWFVASFNKFRNINDTFEFETKIKYKGISPTIKYAKINTNNNSQVVLPTQNKNLTQTSKSAT